MKQFYVMNLDARRVIIIAGLLFSLLGMALYAGMRIGKKNESVKHSSFSESLGKIEIPAKESEAPKTAQVVLPAQADVLPALTKIPEAKAENSEKVIAEKMSELNVATKKTPEADLEVQEDPMISRPPRSIKAETIEKTTSVKAKPGEFYTIQVAAYKHKKDAESTLKKIKAEGINGRIERGKSLWFLRVGKTKTREKLNTSLKKLKGMDLEPIVRKLAKAKVTQASED